MQYYDNTTEDFFRELNYNQYNMSKKNRQNSGSSLYEYPNFNLYNTSPRLKLSSSHSPPQSNSQRPISSSQILTPNINGDNINNSGKNLTPSEPKTKAVRKFSSVPFSRCSSNVGLYNSNENPDIKKIPHPLKNKLVSIKTQTNKKSLEISDSISVDYYYSNIISFEVDQSSLCANFHKRTKHRKKRENTHHFNFISKYIPNCEFNESKIVKEQVSESALTLSDSFDEGTKNHWEATLKRFRSMKSTKSVFNSIRLSEFKQFILTKIVNDQPQNNSNIEENHILNFQLFYEKNETEERDETKSKAINNPDIIHLYAWHNFLIDPKKISMSLIQIFQNNLNEGDDQELNDIISRILNYLFLWISLFPCDFMQKKNESKEKESQPAIFIDDIINLLNSIISSSPNFIKPSMTILAVIYFIYNGEVNPTMFSHFPCIRPKMIAKQLFEYGQLIDLRVEPSVLAKHFTYTELRFLRNVSRNDLISDQWEKSENLHSLMKRFNDTCLFILSSIVKADKSLQIQKVCYWIEVMSEAMKLRNYQLMFEIEAALSSPFLNAVKSGVPISSNLKFDKLKSFIYSKHYNEDLCQRRELCIPFFGLILKDIWDIIVVKNNQHNFLNTIQKVKEGIDAFEFFFSEWGTDYAFEIDSSLLKSVYELEGKNLTKEELERMQKEQRQ